MIESPKYVGDAGYDDDESPFELKLENLPSGLLVEEDGEDG